MSFDTLKVLATWPTGLFSNCPIQGYTFGTQAQKVSNAPMSNITGPLVSWQSDFSGQTNTTIANGASATFPVGSGLVTVNDLASGDVSLWVCGGGGCALSSTSNGHAVASTTTPAAGKYSVAYGGGTGYAIYNNEGSAVNFNVALFRTRAAL